jgi:hypothetical protein
MSELLRQSLPPVEAGAEPARDLWPLLLKRLDARPAAPPWFDWALIAGLAVLAALFPAMIPVFLYYL